MPKTAKFQLPDGRIAKFEVPDDATPEQAHALAMEANPEIFGDAVADHPAPAAAPVDRRVTEPRYVPKKGEPGYDDFLKGGWKERPDGLLDAPAGSGTVAIKPGTVYNGPIRYSGADDQRPTSQLQGFVEGIEKPFNNTAQWATNALNMIPVGDVANDPSKIIGGGDALNNLGHRLFGMAPTVDAAVDSQKQGRDQSGYQSAGVGRFAGEMVGTALLSRLPGNALSQGAQAGALLTDTPNDPLQVAKDAGVGAVAGSVGDAALRGVARVVAPVVAPDIRRLINAGIRPTSGQIAGAADGDVTANVAGRTVRKVEDIVSSVPIAGAAVKNAQYRGVIDLNRSVANRALAPVGGRLPDNVATGQDAIRYTGDQLSQAYNQVLPRLNGQGDNAFATRIRALVARADLPEQYNGQVQSTINEALKAFRPRTPVTGNVTPITFDQIGSLPPRIWEFNGRRLRDASERLGDLAAGWRRSDDPYMRIMADIATGAREQLHALARRQNPEAAGTLRNIDRGYATLVRAERAAAGTADGIFTPRQYDSAVRGMDGSARRRQSARGLAFDQDLSGAASRVMGNTAANGGSKDVNSLVALGVLGTRAAGGDPIAIGGLGTVVGGSAAYSQPGQAAIRAIIARNPGASSTAIADLLRLGARTAPYIAPQGVEAGRQYLTTP